MDKICKFFECDRNNGKGECRILTEPGGTKRTMCTFYKNRRTKFKCSSCMFCKVEENRKYPHCQYWELALSNKQDACCKFVEDEI